jgi:hypothetical protein
VGIRIGHIGRSRSQDRAIGRSGLGGGGSNHSGRRHRGIDHIDHIGQIGRCAAMRAELGSSTGPSQGSFVDAWGDPFVDRDAATDEVVREGLTN